MTADEVTTVAVEQAARKIIRWGVSEARERDAMYQEAENLASDATDEQLAAIAARIEAAVAQGLASSPEFSSEWLAERDREVAAGALREAADAEFSGNVGDTWDGLHPHDVLTARADRIARGEAS